MIRGYKVEDTPQLLRLISNDDTGYEIDDINNIQKNVFSFNVFEEERIKGFSYATQRLRESGELVVDMKIYVEPQSRRKGIGTALFTELSNRAALLNPDVLTAYIRVNIQDSGLFCKQMGFEKWWGSPELFFDGDPLPEVNIEFVEYKDKYFEQFIKVVQDAYYELHRKNGLKTYLATPESVSKYQLKNKNNVFLALDNQDKIIASVTIGEGTVDNLMVSPEYQGKGYGKKALQYGMNKIINKGYKEIRICYIEGNSGAEKLYYSLGFKPVQITHVYRKKLK